ncbi:MAG TPA: hypothetical protein DCP97_05285 [Ruminococcaceae bacterium]|nr:hypothetical protein [Oscillospiraceae bacterium]
MNKKEFCLKLASAVAGSCAIVPLLSLFAWIKKLSAVSVVPKLYIGYVICTAIGFFAAFLFDSAAERLKKSRIKFNTAVMFFSPLWCVFSAYLMYNNNFMLTSLLYASSGENSANPVPSAIFATSAIYIIASAYGSRMYIRSQNKLLNQANYMAVTVTNVACIFVVGLVNWQSQFDSSHEEVARRLDVSFMVPVYLFYIITFMLVNNQTNISFVMDRRKNSHASLPKSIRKFNLLLTSGICAAVFLLYIIRDKIALLIDGLLYIVKMFIFGIAWLIVFISGLFTFKTPNDPGPEKALENAFRPEFQSKDSSFTQVLIYLVFILFVILIVYQYWRVLYNLFIKLAALIKKIFYSLTKNAVNVEQVENSDYYYDSVEQLQPLGDYKNSRQRQLGEAAKLKQALKQYKRIDNPKEMVTGGYRLFKAYFKLNGVKIAESDTAREIDKKLRDSTFKIKSDDISSVYEQVKYNEQTPDMNTARKIYDKIIDTVK